MSPSPRAASWRLSFRSWKRFRSRAEVHPAYVVVQAILEIANREAPLPTAPADDPNQ